MHAEAYAGFGRALAASGLDRRQPFSILDIGGQNVNGTVHDYFTHSETIVTTLDLENADIIADARTWIPERLFDIVVATEVFEHVKDWRAVVATAAKALRKNGPGVALFTCASSGRPPHGATGDPLPAKGEWYENVLAADLNECMREHWHEVRVEYLYPPGDAYAWARGPL